MQYNPTYSGEYLEVPCGGCVGCRIDRSREWAIRCTHEAQMHRENCFITLTYAPEHLPPRGSLEKAAFQAFMKRLRKHFSPAKIRFFACGEYGSDKERPHYHACIFGVGFDDKYPWSKRGDNITYRSATLEKLWPFGISEIGAVTWQSAAYTARYIMKKINGPDAEDAYQKVDITTGEIVDLEREFVLASLKPGLGYDWFQKYWRDVFPSDRVVLDGKEYSVPRYYYKLLEQLEPEMAEEIKAERTQRAKEVPEEERSTKRLAARQEFKERQTAQLRRGYEEGSQP